MDVCHGLHGCEHGSVSCRDKRDGPWYVPEHTHTVGGAVHTLAVSPDHSQALAGDAQGTLTPLDLQSLHSVGATPATVDMLSGGSGPTDGVYNLAVQGGVLGIDAAALRPILAVIGKTGGIKCATQMSIHILHSSCMSGLCPTLCRHRKSTPSVLVEQTWPACVHRLITASL